MLGIYTRISGKKKDGKDTSIEIQSAEGIKVAMRLKMQYKLYVDEGLSGTLDDVDGRPAFADMMRDIDKDKIKAVFVFDQARLERNTNIWQMFQFQVIKKDVKFYINGVETDLSDPSIKFATGILSLTNQLFAEQTRMKVGRTFDLRASKGLTHGVLPYGYKKGIDGKYEINETEAAVVRRIFNLSLEGIGTYTIANILNDEGVLTKYRNIGGKETYVRFDKYTGEATTFKRTEIIWRGTVVYGMIRNSIYKGIRTWNKVPKGKKETITASILPIIDPELFDKVNRNLINNKQKAGKKSEFNYLLNGLITCGYCGKEYRGKKRLATKDSAYKCSSIGKCPDSRGISIIRLENFIINHLFIDKNLKELLLDLPENNTQINSLKNKLIKVENELKNKTSLRDKYLNWLDDEELEGDVAVIDKYKKTKREVEVLQNNIEILKLQILESDNQFAKMRIENAANEFQLTKGFDDTKRLIHSIIDKITINHVKKERGGNFYVEIKYKGFEEYSLFMTNWLAIEWNWLSYYRSKANNEQQLIEDMEQSKALLDFQGIEYSDADFEGFEGNESVTGMHDLIVLDNANLISFN